VAGGLRLHVRVGEQEADSTVANALSLSQMSGLAKDEAVGEAWALAQAVDGWKEYFEGCGVTPGDIDLYAVQIDR
jgi:serine/threonine-protein kinase HipA